MEQFDEFRRSLLRYSLSLGLPIHDAEEVIHEAFLALFPHLHWVVLVSTCGIGFFASPTTSR